MFDFLFNSPAFQLLIKADMMTKVVLFALFCLSIFCLWVALSKLILLWQHRSSLDQLMSQVKRVKTFDELLSLGKKYRKNVGGRFLIKAFGELKELLDVDFKSDGQSGFDTRGKKVSLTPGDIERLEILFEQSIDDVAAEEEQYLPVLGTSAAVAPLIGLFGTVWGLVHAFVDISRHRSADIAVVAPGIAEALTTTLAGLIVAIPAVIFFHYFSNELRKVELKLWSLSDKLLAIVKQTFAL